MNVYVLKEEVLNFAPVHVACAKKHFNYLDTGHNPTTKRALRNSTCPPPQF